MHLSPSHFVQFFLWTSVIFFHLGHVSFSPHFDCLPVFASMYWVELLYLLVLIVGVLWGPEAQIPWSPELSTPGSQALIAVGLSMGVIEPQADQL